MACSALKLSPLCKDPITSFMPGDIGDPQILDKLAAIAPLTAVRGNVDHGAWAQKIPATNVLEVGEISIYVLHSLQELDLKPEAGKFAVSRLRA